MSVHTPVHTCPREHICVYTHSYECAHMLWRAGRTAETQKARILCPVLFLTLWPTAEPVCAPPSSPSLLPWLRSLGCSERLPSKAEPSPQKPKPEPSSLLTRNRSSQEVCNSWIISTGAPSSVMVVSVSGMSSLSW